MKPGYVILREDFPNSENLNKVKVEFCKYWLYLQMTVNGRTIAKTLP